MHEAPWRGSRGGLISWCAGIGVPDGYLLIAQLSFGTFTTRVQSDDSEIEGVSAFFDGWAMEAIQVGPRSGRTLASCVASRSHRTLRLEAGSPLVLQGSVQEGHSCILLSASPTPAIRFLGNRLRTNDLVLAGAEAHVNLFIPYGAIVFVLVVPTGGLIPRRALRICGYTDSQALTHYIMGPQAERRSASLTTLLGTPTKRRRFPAHKPPCVCRDDRLPLHREQISGGPDPA